MYFYGISISIERGDKEKRVSDKVSRIRILSKVSISSINALVISHAGPVRGFSSAFFARSVYKIVGKIANILIKTVIL